MRNNTRPMRNKKNTTVIALLLALALLLTGCFAAGEEPREPAKVNPDSSVTDGETSVRQTEEQTEPQVEKPVLEQMEIYNDKGVVVTVNGLEDGLFGPEISVTVENNSDKNVIVSTQELSVNGYMFSSSGMFADVAAGKKAKESLNLMNSEMDSAGVDTVAEVSFWLKVYDSDSYQDIAESDLITLRTSVADTYVQPVDDSGQLIYSDHDIRVICKGLKDDSIWDGTVVFYIENNSGESISIYTEDVSINGFMVSDSMWADLRPGTRSVEGMYLLSLEEADVESIADVETVEFSLKIINEKWREIDKTDPIELTFE